MMLPVATYRLQLRDGLGFAEAETFLPHLKHLGISHLYLSPIFTAATGSTHGYDITRPDQIDPVLGGAAGFARLSDAARAAEIGIILDIVPNHTAFSLENPWLWDVLHRGRDSQYARHFDIDWDIEGRIVLPWLSETFAALAASDAVRRQGDRLVVGDLAIPLRDNVHRQDVNELHDIQHWRLAHWSAERDAITHRRFFNVTGLIGMRIEDQMVFDDMHRCVLELVRNGQVQALRVDHIDGLADPEGYLHRLRAAVGDTPIWVEKILTGDEILPPVWPVQGTTGYEAATMIARLLTDAQGAARLIRRWQHDTGSASDFHDQLLQAKHEVLRRDLAAELRRLIGLAQAALTQDLDIAAGEEALREVFIALLVAFPRYRSYLTPRVASADDLALMGNVLADAATGLRDDGLLRRIADFILRPDNSAQIALQRRFQQVTGALLAKSHEDTAGFRYTPYLPACEVGADPDVLSVDLQGFAAWAAMQPGTGLLLTSSHDTKRSEDARMRLVAMSHLPDAALTLQEVAKTYDKDDAIPPNLRWYLVQATIAIWSKDDPALVDRVTAHAIKAMREADEITSWTHPVKQTERQVTEFAEGLIGQWRSAPPPEMADIVAMGARLSLAQLALKLILPGVPDIYRGCEGVHLALTDPDNRRPVALSELSGLLQASGLAGEKARMTQNLLLLRAAQPDLFRVGTVKVERHDDALHLWRHDRGATFCLRIALTGGLPEAAAPIFVATLDGHAIVDGCLERQLTPA